MNKMHTISVPYSVMKTCPLSWVQRVHAHKGNHTHARASYETVEVCPVENNLCCGGFPHSRVDIVGMLLCYLTVLFLTNWTLWNLSCC